MASFSENPGGILKLSIARLLCCRAGRLRALISAIQLLPDLSEQCVFRSNPATDYDLTRPPNMIQAGHPGELWGRPSDFHILSSTGSERATMIVDVLGRCYPSLPRMSITAAPLFGSSDSMSARCSWFDRPPLSFLFMSLTDMIRNLPLRTVKTRNRRRSWDGAPSATSRSVNSARASQNFHTISVSPPPR